MTIIGVMRARLSLPSAALWLVAIVLFPPFGSLAWLFRRRGGDNAPRREA